MTVEIRSLACAGLSAHEAATVRLVSNSLADRLSAEWQLVTEGDADVVVADPSTEAGRAALELAPSDKDVIAVLDRNTSQRPPAHRYLYRPLRPAALVDLLNQSQAGAGPSNADADASVGLSELATAFPKTIGQGLREAMRDALIGSIDVIALGTGELAIDIERDRLVGPVGDLDVAALTDQTVYPVYRLYAPVARARTSGADEMHLTVGLWRLLGELDRDRALYGAADRTPVWLTRWPRLPSQRLARPHLRAATALRQAPRTAVGLARELGIEASDVIALCNGAWLMGDLEIAETAAVDSRPKECEESAQRSLASRIRQRLGVS